MMGALDLKSALRVDSEQEVPAVEPVSRDPGLARDDGRMAEDTVCCEACARDAGYATVFRGGSRYCSVECAEAVAGLYLG